MHPEEVSNQKITFETFDHILSHHIASISMMTGSGFNVKRTKGQKERSVEENVLVSLVVVVSGNMYTPSALSNSNQLEWEGM